MKKFIKWLERNDPPRHKYRDEKVILRLIGFPSGFVLVMFFFQSDRSYSWAEMALFMTVAFMWGNLCGHRDGVETERLFPSGYRWDGDKKIWIKKDSE